MAPAIEPIGAPLAARGLDHELVIVGSGFAGIGVAIKLKKMGIDDFIILEKADDLGGTWRDNDYPGLAVDMPSFIYSYPFEMSSSWSRVYAPAHEIKAYADHCVAKYGVRPHIRFVPLAARSPVPLPSVAPWCARASVISAAPYRRAP